MSLKLKQGFITQDMKKISSAFKTILRNTSCDAQKFHTSIVRPVGLLQSTWTRSTTLPRQIEQTSSESSFNGEQDIYSYDINPKMQETNTNTASDIMSPVRCVECHQLFHNPSDIEYLYISVLKYQWVPVCTRCNS